MKCLSPTMIQKEKKFANCSQHKISPSTNARRPSMSRFRPRPSKMSLLQTVVLPRMPPQKIRWLCSLLADVSHTKAEYWVRISTPRAMSPSRSRSPGSVLFWRMSLTENGSHRCHQFCRLFPSRAGNFDDSMLSCWRAQLVSNDIFAATRVITASSRM